ncbi:LacI family DNA-binding transcriptional regulator [Micromonospora sp. HM5-17]|jgi:DNA-binding LacI/PurR family transcriptional regulator|uniref:LacI family DNA-binding transcriptional regulator n=1 Tax=Micromonospora sp. HM5-17 TaxID=2487710 RepID=UPI000F474BF8|nr:LacI family DNA-binding transcriptional regulator [Micromonospora sp. HM5-17]ROT33015.1 LacI family transcriptional regulator [Micromonospora sp. HM5-17]
MTARPADATGRPTLEQVAEAAGVSRATVSRVINAVPTVDPRIRAAVERAIAEIGYVPNLAARSLVTRRTDSMALIVSEPPGHATVYKTPFLQRLFTDPYIGRVTAGAQEVLRPRNIHLVIIPADPPAHHMVLRYLRQGHVDGVLLISSHGADPLPQQLVDLGIPAVLSARPGRPVPLSYVDVDQQGGARLAAEHLVGSGRRRLATICGPQDMPAGQDRLAGFRSAVAAQLGVDVPAEQGDFTRSGGEAATHRLLDRHPEIDGLFAANDLMAEGAIRALQERGRRVPEDVGVVGFDDSSAAVESHPQLTTIRQPVEEMAGEMAQLLLARLREPDRTARSVIFNPTLVVRQSA